VAAELAKPRKKTSIRTIEELDALVDDVIEVRIPTMVGHMLEGCYPLPLVPESYPSDIDLARRFNRAVQAARAAFMGIAEDEEEADDAE